MKKIAVVFGTRPEIIKLAPIINAIKKPITIFTGQHYTKELSDDIFNDLDLPLPLYNLNIIEKTHANQIAKMIVGIEEILLKEKPEWLIVQGDTNSTLAGALAASKIGVKILHIEAGARSFNRAEPEEINRVLTDHLANINIGFNKESILNLKKEGITKNVFNIPNTAYQVCYEQVSKLNTYKKQDKHLLVTIHRATNTNDPKRMKNIVSLLNKLSHNCPIIFPMHPRTQKILADQNLVLSKNVKVIKPLGYNDFLQAIHASSAVLSDSGGVVDECALMQKRLVILRNETERMDIVKNGTAILVSPDLGGNVALRKIATFLNKQGKPPIPFKINQIKKIASKILSTIEKY